MGVRFRKSAKLPGGGRLNFSKSGVGYSLGGKGFRVTKTARGTTRTTASIHGTGLSYSDESKVHHQAKSACLTNKMLSIALFALFLSVIIFSFAVLFSSCSDQPNDTEGRNSSPIQSQDPVSITQKSEEAKNGVAYLTSLGFSTVTSKESVTMLEFMVTMSGFSDQEPSDLPDTWDDVYSTVSSAASGLSDELIDANKKIVLYLQDSRGNNYLSFSDGKELYNFFTPKQDQDEVSKDSIIIVWISDSGSRYHSDPGCSGMKDSRSVTLEYAKNNGYTACGRCVK